MDRRLLLRHATAAALGAATVAEGGEAQAQGRLRDGGVNVRAFGAKGDGLADDTLSIQAAIDHALRNRLQTVHLPGGTYRTSDTLHLGHGDNYVTVALVGEATFSYAGATAGAVIKPDRFDRPAINIQGGRGTLIRNIALKGRNIGFLDRKFADGPKFAEPDPKAWLDPELSGGLRRYAPYAAITVDAFSGPAHVDGFAHPTPPAWTGNEKTTPRGLFSSDIIIDRCWIGGFAVAIAIQPCDADGNGDFVKIIGSVLTHGVYGIAVGNGQSRNVALRDCTYSYLHTFLTNKPFGRGVGTLGGPIDNVSGGSSYQFMDVNAGATLPLTVSHLYFEAQTRIGVWSVVTSFNNTLVFQSCTFDFNELYLGYSPGALLECGTLGSVLFIGCTFSLARRIWNIAAGASHVRIDSCMFGILSDYRGTDFYKTIPEHVAKALNYTCGGAFLPGDSLKGECELAGGNTGLAFDLDGKAGRTQSRGRALAAERGKRISAHRYALEFIDVSGHLWTIRGRRKPGLISKRPGDGQLLRLEAPNSDEIRLTLPGGFEASFGGPVLGGDLIHDPGSGALFAVKTVTRTAQTLTLAATQLNNLRAAGERLESAGPMSREGGYLWLHCANLMLGDSVFFGDFTAGSTTVANVHRGDGAANGLTLALQSGDMLHFAANGPPAPGGDRPQPYPAMTAIVAASESERTITLNNKALFTTRFLLSTLSLSG